MGNKAHMVVDNYALPEYFHDEVERAMLRLGVEVSETTEFYLVNLLSGFCKTESLFVLRGDEFEEEPLALMLDKALSGDRAAQIKGLKRLGDVTLYISGFFTEHLLKGTVGKRYYADMGVSAYSALSSLFAPDEVFAELYNELAARFIELAGVIAETGVPQEAADNITLLKMYERWIKTGDESLRKKLVQEGLIPVDKKISC
jgi:hypothetical protein